MASCIAHCLSAVCILGMASFAMAVNDLSSDHESPPAHFFTNGTVAYVQHSVCEYSGADGWSTRDFGRAAFGWLEARCRVGRTNVVVRLGERLTGDGRVCLNPGGTIRAVESIALIGDEWTRVPIVADKRNTEGRNRRALAVRLPDEVGVILPFRYAEMPSWVECRRLAVAWPICQRVVFDSDDERLRRLWDFCTYSIRATTFAGVYVDGDRERIPYEGDAYINMMGQLYGVDGDPELARRTIRHLLLYPTWPTEWRQHLIMCVWEDWHFTEDASFAAECYDSIVRDCLMLDRARADGLLPSDPGSDLVDWPPVYRDGYDMATSANAVVNAFHYRNLVEMEDLAAAVGKSNDAMRFRRRAEKVRQSFEKSFYDPETGLYVDGEGSRHASLHANVAALNFGLVAKPDVRGKVADFIASRGMVCSPYFAQYLLEALFRFGRREAAMKLLLDDGPRSWLGMLNQGSTITLEAWNSSDKPNLDWNHAWGAVPANIIPRFVSK